MNERAKKSIQNHLDFLVAVWRDNKDGKFTSPNEYFLTYGVSPFKRDFLNQIGLFDKQTPPTIDDVIKLKLLIKSRVKELNTKKKMEKQAINEYEGQSKDLFSTPLSKYSDEELCHELKKRGDYIIKKRVIQMIEM